MIEGATAGPVTPDWPLSVIGEPSYRRPMRIRIVDAFTDRPFHGNPAGVLLLDTAFPRTPGSSRSLPR